MISLLEWLKTNVKFIIYKKYFIKILISKFNKESLRNNFWKNN